MDELNTDEGVDGNMDPGGRETAEELVRMALSSASTAARTTAALVAVTATAAASLFVGVHAAPYAAALIEAALGVGVPPLAMAALEAFYTVVGLLVWALVGLQVWHEAKRRARRRSR